MSTSRAMRSKAARVSKPVCEMLVPRTSLETGLEEIKEDTSLFTNETLDLFEMLNAVPDCCSLCGDPEPPSLHNGCRFHPVCGGCTSDFSLLADSNGKCVFRTSVVMTNGVEKYRACGAQVDANMWKNDALLDAYRLNREHRMQLKHVVDNAIAKKARTGDDATGEERRRAALEERRKERAVQQDVARLVASEAQSEEAGGEEEVSPRGEERAGSPVLSSAESSRRKRVRKTAKQKWLERVERCGSREEAQREQAKEEKERKRRKRELYAKRIAMLEPRDSAIVTSWNHVIGNALEKSTNHMYRTLVRNTPPCIVVHDNGALKSWFVEQYEMMERAVMAKTEKYLDEMSEAIVEDRREKRKKDALKKKMKKLSAQVANDDEVDDFEDAASEEEPLEDGSIANDMDDVASVGTVGAARAAEDDAIEIADPDLETCVE